MQSTSEKDTYSRENMKDLENIMLIWLNEIVDKNNDDYRKTRDDLEQINGLLKIFTDPKECMNYLRTMDKTKILLIISETFGQELLSQIEALQAVICVFINYNDNRYKECLHVKYPTTITNISTNQTSLVELVHRRIRYETEEVAFSIFTEAQMSTRDLKVEFPLLLWSQLLLDVLKRFPNDRERALKEILKVCKHYCEGKKADLEEIEHFSATYEAEKNAVFWYTKNNFVHRILNEALRTRNIDYLYSFRFFIIDLVEQLKQERLQGNGVITLYRGQRISKHEIDRIKRNVRSSIAINGFLSTSRSKDVATLFLRKGLAEASPIQSVLFIITADPSIKAVTFADIQHLSQISDEREVLFTLSTIFKIDEVYFDHENLKAWIVKMTATNERLTQVQKYIEVAKKEHEWLNIDVIFARLLVNMDELFKAELYLNRMLPTTQENTLDKATLLAEMGNLNLRRNNYLKAEEMFNDAYTIRKKLLSEDHYLIARSLSNLAAVSFFTFDIKKAIEYNKKALSIDQKSFKGDHILISKDLFYLGKNYEAIGQFDDALKQFQRALNIQQRLFYPITKHPKIAGTLWSIGSIHATKPDYKAALNFFMKALQMYEETLPCGHQKVIRLFSSIVDTHIANGKFDDALKFCKTKLGDYEQRLEAGRSGIGKIQKLMGDIEFKRNNYNDAFEYFEQALKLFKTQKQSEYEPVIECLNCIAETEKHRENYSEALNYLNKSLKIQRTAYLPDQPKIAQTLRQIGLVHMKFRIYHEAAPYFMEALQIFQSKFNNDHQDVKITLANLKEVEQIMRH